MARFCRSQPLFLRCDPCTFTPLTGHDKAFFLKARLAQTVNWARLCPYYVGRGLSLICTLARNCGSLVGAHHYLHTCIMNKAWQQVMTMIPVQALDLKL